MDVLDDELLRFWKSLNDNHVRYIMVESERKMIDKEIKLS